MKLSVNSEHIEQVTFVNWFKLQYPRGVIFAIPNGELRAISVAQRLRAEGVKSGVPDLCCIFPNSAIVWVEMKKSKGGTVSKEQKEVHALFESMGQTVIIGKGWEDAKEKLQIHIKSLTL